MKNQNGRWNASLVIRGRRIANITTNRKDTNKPHGNQKITSKTHGNRSTTTGRGRKPNLMASDIIDKETLDPRKPYTLIIPYHAIDSPRPSFLIQPQKSL